MHPNIRNAGAFDRMLAAQPVAQCALGGPEGRYSDDIVDEARRVLALYEKRNPTSAQRQEAEGAEAQCFDMLMRIKQLSN